MAWGNRADRIDHDGPRFVWQQVADDIAHDIRSGELPTDSRLPSEQELADIYQVARGTIRRAIVHLMTDQELITVVHGRGTFVT